MRGLFWIYTRVSVMPCYQPSTFSWRYERAVERLFCGRRTRARSPKPSAGGQADPSWRRVRTRNFLRFSGRKILAKICVIVEKLWQWMLNKKKLPESLKQLWIFCKSLKQNSECLSKCPGCSKQPCRTESCGRDLTPLARYVHEYLLLKKSLSRSCPSICGWQNICCSLKKFE